MKSPDPNRLPLPVEWYETEQDYLDVIAMLPISERKAIPFEAFRAGIENKEASLRNRGAVTRRIPVSPAAIRSWCNANGYPVCKVSIVCYLAETIAILSLKEDEHVNNMGSESEGSVPNGA
jgi:hypothetical protein